MATIWDERFQRETFVYGEAPSDFLRIHAGRFPPHGEILSLGEGEGRNAVHLAEQGYRVTALDSSVTAMQKLAGLAERRGVQVASQLADVSGADLGAAGWDGILNVFCHVSSGVRPGLLARIRKALRPGGVFLTEQFSTDQLAYDSGGPRDRDLLVDLSEFEAAFEGMEILLATKELVTLDEGPFHQGRASVIRFIARKPL